MNKEEQKSSVQSLPFSFSLLKIIYLGIKQSKTSIHALERKQSYRTRVTQTTPEAVQTVADSLNYIWIYKWR